MDRARRHVPRSFAVTETGKAKVFMTEPLSPLVHTEQAASFESTASDAGQVQLRRRAGSSAGERSVHTGKVGGSTPSPPTAYDPLADLLANETARLKAEERFWPKVMKPLGWDQCWLWTASRNAKGYGRFKVTSYVSIVASRVAYALYYNRSPGSLLVCHHCDNPQCVNPTHLYLGTVKDNSDDKMRRGRWRGPPDPKGENNGAAKLRAVDVEAIRGLINAGLNNKAIAARYGVTHQLISRIRRGRSWGCEAMQKPYESLRARRRPVAPTAEEG